MNLLIIATILIEYSVEFRHFLWLIRISLERWNQALNNGNWLVDLNHLKTDDQHSRVR